MTLADACRIGPPLPDRASELAWQAAVELCHQARVARILRAQDQRREAIANGEIDPK